MFRLRGGLALVGIIGITSAQPAHAAFSYLSGTGPFSERNPVVASAVEYYASSEPFGAYGQRYESLKDDTTLIDGAPITAGPNSASAKVVTRPYVSKIDAHASSAGEHGEAFASAMSFWAVNQKLVGPAAPGATERVGFFFGVDGDYAPTSSDSYFNFAVGIFLGEVYATRAYVGNNGTDIYAYTSFGAFSLWDDEEDGVDLPPGVLLGYDELCANGCPGGQYKHTLSIVLDVPIGVNYIVAAYVDVDRIEGSLDFFKTVTLNSIVVPNGFTLESDPSLLRLSDDGSYVLANAPPVPEPATWAMLITGFGFVGASMRRRGIYMNGRA